MSDEFLYFCGAMVLASLAFIAWTAAADIRRLRRIAREARRPKAPVTIEPNWYCEYARGAGEEF